MPCGDTIQDHRMRVVHCLQNVFFPPQETSFASNQPVTRSLSSVTASKKSSSSSSAATTKVKPPAHSSGAASSSFAGGMDNQVGFAESKQF